LKDALLCPANAARTLGVRAILVHANSDDAQRLYLEHGFVSSPLSAMTLISASPEARGKVLLIGAGEGLRWPSIDEDIQWPVSLQGARPSNINRRAHKPIAPRTRSIC